jgi:hypothetical protein
MATEKYVRREGQCLSYIGFRDYDLELYCDEDEGHGPDHVSRCPGDALIMGRDADHLTDEELEDDANCTTDLEVRWTWPKVASSA